MTNVSISKLESKLAIGNVEAVLGVIPDNYWEELEKELADSFLMSFNNAAEASLTIKKNKKMVIFAADLPKGATLIFDRANPKAIDFARKQAANLVTNISTGQRNAIHDLILKSFNEGIPIRKTAMDIRQQIGLTRPQQKALDNVRSRLVKKGIAPGEIEKRVERQRQKMIRYRATVIAKQENMVAANEGQRALWRQAFDEELLPPEERFLKEWITAGDDRTCPICEPLEGQQVGVDQMFNTSVGALDGPPAHILCRCVQSLTKNPNAPVEPVFKKEEPKELEELFSELSVEDKNIVEDWFGVWSRTGYTNIRAIQKGDNDLISYLTDVWGASLVESEKRQITFIEDLLSKARQETGTVWRGVNLFGVSERKFFEVYKEGVVIRWDAFTSTSKKLKRAIEFTNPETPILFRIENCGGIDITKFSDRPEEAEVLQLKGKTFKVISIQKIKGEVLNIGTTYWDNKKITVISLEGI